MSQLANDPPWKWMWVIVAALLALQLYFVRELLAALLIFTVGFAVVGAVALTVFFLEQGRRRMMVWAERSARDMAVFARRGLVAVEAFSRRPFRRLR